MDLKKVIIYLGITFFILILLITIGFIFLPIGSIRIDFPIEVNIRNTLSSNNNTVLYTRELNFPKDRVLSTSVFESKVDPCSIYFDVSDFEKPSESDSIFNIYNSVIGIFGHNIVHVPELQLIEPISNEYNCGLSVKNMINSDIKVKSIVACSKDPTKLLELLNKNNLPANLPNFFENDNYYTDYVKVCAVIFKRA